MTFENTRHVQKIYKKNRNHKAKFNSLVCKKYTFLKSDSKTLNNNNNKGMSKGILGKD